DEYGDVGDYDNDEYGDEQVDEKNADYFDNDTPAAGATEFLDSYDDTFAEEGEGGNTIDNDYYDFYGEGESESDYFGSGYSETDAVTADEDYDDDYSVTEVAAE